MTAAPAHPHASANDAARCWSCRATGHSTPMLVCRAAPATPAATMWSMSGCMPAAAAPCSPGRTSSARNANSGLARPNMPPAAAQLLMLYPDMGPASSAAAAPLTAALRASPERTGEHTLTLWRSPPGPHTRASDHSGGRTALRRAGAGARRAARAPPSPAPLGPSPPARRTASAPPARRPPRGPAWRGCTGPPAPPRPPPACAACRTPPRAARRCGAARPARPPPGRPAPCRRRPGASAILPACGRGGCDP